MTMVDRPEASRPPIELPEETEVMEDDGTVCVELPCVDWSGRGAFFRIRSNVDRRMLSFTAPPGEFFRLPPKSRENLMRYLKAHER